MMQRGPQMPEGIGAVPMSSNIISSLMRALQIPVPENMGDYVFTQDAMDSIITRLMEQAGRYSTLLGRLILDTRLHHLQQKLQSTLCLK
jgi:hypothetical protein